MELIRPYCEFVDDIDGEAITRKIEAIGRVCYKSEDRIGPGTADRFCNMILSRQHESVIEHVSVTVKFVIDRGVSHELVRHRLAAYSQESTRYCNYGKRGMTFILPPWVMLVPGTYDLQDPFWDAKMEDVEAADQEWVMALCHAERFYNSLLLRGWTPEKARSVLPNSLKTEVVTTYNLRQWRHVFLLRTMEKAHPQMREVMLPLLGQFRQALPIFFQRLSFEKTANEILGGMSTEEIQAYLLDRELAK